MNVSVASLQTATQERCRIQFSTLHILTLEHLPLLTVCNLLYD